MMSKKVSVIIPFYNNISWLCVAIESVLAQSFKDYEIILINDGSPEDMTVFLEKYGEKINYIYKKNGGPASARNLGIEEAKGKYIAFLDSDDIWFERKLELQFNLMEKTGANWSHTNYCQFNNDSPEKIKCFDLKEFSGNIFPESLLSTHIATPCVMVRSEYLKNRNDLRFAPYMRFGQDNYLWLRLSIENKLYLVPEFLCKVRITGNNASKRARAHLQVRAHIWKFLKDDSSKIFYRVKGSLLIRFLYQLCYAGNGFLCWLEKRKIKPSSLEAVSKVIFFIPYFSFKLFHKIIKFLKDKN